VKAMDINHVESDWSQSLTIIIENRPPNNPPEIPFMPNGPSFGIVGVSYNFNTSSTDPDYNDIQYGWDWDNDDEVDDWSDFYFSNTICNMNHTWYAVGEHSLKVKARDIFGNESDWSESFIINIEMDPANNPPVVPYNFNGPVTGTTGIYYNYSARSIDPDNDDIFYLFDWGDGNDSDWLGPFKTGEICLISNNWTEEGTYEIKVKAKDIFNLESEWSDSLHISVPRNNQVNSLQILFQKIIERYPLIKIIFRLVIN
jgi:hypothetical protein